MGQLLPKDSRPQLPTQINEDNVKPVSKKTFLAVCPFLQFQKCEKIFFIQNEQEVQALYKFGSQYTVHLQLKKENSKNIPGIYIKLSDEYVYAYKHRKLDRSDNIKPQKLLFKKRIYIQVQNKPLKQQRTKTNKILQELMIKFAQIKIMSLLEIGAKLGRIYNGCDGVITDEYIEYFSQITIDRIQNCIPKNSELKQLQIKLIHRGVFAQGMLKTQNLSYSRWRKGYLLKQNHYFEEGVRTTNQACHQNQSIHFIVRMFETEVTKAIMDLDNEAKMLPFINNLIFQHDFQKAISKFQQNLPLIEDESQRIQYAEQVSSMISKHSNSSSREYQKKIQKIMSTSSNKQQSKDSLNSARTSRNNSLSLFLQQKIIENSPKSNKLRNSEGLASPSSDQNLPTDILQSISHEQKDQIKQLQNQQPVQVKKGQIKIAQTKKVKLQQKRKLFSELCRGLRNSILDKNNQKNYEILGQMKKLEYKPLIQIQIIFGKILMENARSRHALTIFQKMLYFSNQSSFSQLYNYHEIASLAGIIYFHRYSYKKSLKSFQKALSVLVRLRHYSIKMMAILNNIACIYHVLKNYDQCILNLHRGFRLGEYSVDFQYLMRSNLAMSLAQKGKIKEAKSQMMKVNRVVQPVNDMVIFCKFYSNLAYLELMQLQDSKSIDKVISNFEQACNIEDKHLIPNGYRPSIFLHNNMAMLHYKRKEFKKAKFHSQKILNQLNEVQGIVAVKVHFNIGKIFSQGYNYDLPLKHFHEARILLNKLDQSKQNSIRSYKEVIDKEIEELEKMRIDQVSEQQSYKFSYMSSSLLKKI